VDYGIYAHVPFCTRRCDYCDFFVAAGVRHDTAGFFRTLERDLARAVLETGPAPPGVDTIYVGGGTPSMVDPAFIGGFLRECARCALPAGDAEVTIEANPETVTPESAAFWLESGVTRLSLGVQSFASDVLSPRGRVYDGDGACAAFHHARAAGFDNIGCDLIAGLPGETLETFEAGLDRLLGELRPDHVSIYLLETEESLKHTPLSRAVREGRAALSSDDDVVRMYETGCERLAGAGYRHYEISNFCRPGRASRHNMKYWLSTPWIGIGPSACSYVNGRRESRPADMSAWRMEVEENGATRAPVPEASEAWREALILQLRLVAGVDPGEFSARWGGDAPPLLEALAAEPGFEDLIEREGASYRLTSKGRLLSNEVFARIL